MSDREFLLTELPVRQLRVALYVRQLTELPVRQLRVALYRGFTLISADRITCAPAEGGAICQTADNYLCANRGRRYTEDSL